MSKVAYLTKKSTNLDRIKTSLGNLFFNLVKFGGAVLCVSGEKDAVDEVTGEPIYQLIDTEKMLPHMVGAIKDLTQLVNELRTELNAAKIEIEAMKTEMATFV